MGDMIEAIGFGTENKPNKKDNIDTFVLNLQELEDYMYSNLNFGDETREINFSSIAFCMQEGSDVELYLREHRLSTDAIIEISEIYSKTFETADGYMKENKEQLLITVLEDYIQYL